jgi:hypothetical protein
MRSAKHHKLWLLTIAVVAALVPRGVEAESGELEQGATVRIQRAGERVVGVVEELRIDTLLVRLDHTGPRPRGRSYDVDRYTREHVPLSEIQSLELSVPRSSAEGSWRGLGFGFLVGATYGAVIGISVRAASEGSDWELITPVGGAVAFGLIGALVGSLAGRASPGVEWEPVDLPVQLGARWDHNGRRIGFALRF